MSGTAFVGPELIIFNKKVLEIVHTSVFKVLNAVWLALRKVGTEHAIR